MTESKSRTLDRPLFILQYLIRNTDDDHKVSLNQLISVCRSSGHGGNRHTISNDIDILCHYGFDIICSKEGNKNTYSYGCRRLTQQSYDAHGCVGSSVSLPLKRLRSSGKKNSKYLRKSRSRKAVLNGLCTQVATNRQSVCVSND